MPTRSPLRPVRAQRSPRAVWLLVLLVSWTLAPPARADVTQPARDFYRGSTVELFVGYGPGGGYDAYARLLAPHLAERLGATIVVRNRPGAGGLAALNRLVAGEPDGLAIMLLNGEAAVLAQLVDKPGVRFDLRSVSWLGRVNAETYVMLVSRRSGYASIAELRSAPRPVKFSAADRTGGTGALTSSVCAALAAPCKLILGYKGSKEASLAAIRGETDAITLTESSAVKLLAGDQVVALAALARQRSHLLPDTPTIFEQAALTPGGAWWIDFTTNAAGVGRVLVAPPEVPDERVALLREVVEDTLSDPAVRAGAERMRRPIRSASPEHTAAQVAAVLGSLDAARLREVRDVLLRRY